MESILGSRTPRARRTGIHCICVAVSIVLLSFLVACGSSSSSHPSHNAYISFPSSDSIGLFHIDDSSGALGSVSNSVPLTGTGPTGIALHPSGKFLYAANSVGNSVSSFLVGGDGTLSQNGNAVPAGIGPFGAVMDSSGGFLLITNQISNSISVFSVDSGSGSPSLVSTFTGPPSLPQPTEILITPSGKFVYVLTSSTNNTVNGFTFSAGTLTAIPGSPFHAGLGTSGIAVDPGEHFLYTANTSDNTVSAFQIDSNTGALSPIIGSPYSSTAGTQPSALAVDTTGKFLYVATPGSSNSIWVFSISSVPGSEGELTPVVNTPFSLAGGNRFMVMEPRGKFFYIGASGNIPGYTYDTTTGKPTVITGSPFGTGPPPGKMIVTP